MSTVVVATVKSNSSSPPVFQNTSGTEVGTLCRAWVNFNGTGTVAIRSQFNVSSITDNGTGNYTVNFTSALADANYSAVISGDGQSAVNVTVGGVRAYNTGSAQIDVGSVGTSSSIPSDRVTVSVAIFR